MNNTELYINGRLMDTDGDLGVRLNRKLLDPAAVNTVDAQYSYTISLPPTQRNNEALSYANVEETRNKFNRVYVAELIVNSVRVFGPGLFRLTSVEDGFKGQLYMPAKKTIKEIFGDKKLNQNSDYRIPFIDFATYVNMYNAAAANAPQPAIFPYILYGVLPKVPSGGGTYSARDRWDSTVRTGLSDLPPAINTLQLLKHIFNSQGYTLQGTAFQDERLKQLYQSYKNDPEYVQPWNYGQYAKIELNGVWSSYLNKRDPLNPYLPEVGVFRAPDDVYAVDLFDASNVKINITADPGGNVLYKTYIGADHYEYANTQVRIPTAGFYKVTFKASIGLDRGDSLPDEDEVTGVTQISAKSDGPDGANMEQLRSFYEVRLLRDRGKGDFGVSSARLAGAMYMDNQPQNAIFDSANIPKYFPHELPDIGQINLIDLAQDPKTTLGFSFGTREGYNNPAGDGGALAEILVAKPAYSWDTSLNGEGLTRLAVQNPGYWEYGIHGGVLGYQLSDKYKIDLNNSPANFSGRGTFNGAPGNQLYDGEGYVNAVVWLEAGELLTVASITQEGYWHRDAGPFHGTAVGWVRHDIVFSLSVTPFRTDPEWLKVNTAGDGTAPMDWDDAPNFDTDNINLTGFLDADVKTDDFINNFCNAYNLALVQVDDQTFSLDIKQSKSAVSNVFIDLDGIASVAKRANTPLGIPSRYVLGFTIDEEEEGYIETGEDGGGTYTTGATEESVITQTSAFSYNWYKALTKTETGGPIIITVPIISKSDVWDLSMSYPDAMAKRYTNLAQRFMYYNGILPGTYDFNGAPLNIAQVSNELAGLSILNYKNIPRSILANYFTIFISGASHYTAVKAYLTAQGYTQLDGSRFARFNGDVYYVAELSGYDPYARNQTTIKLIRKI